MEDVVDASRLWLPGVIERIASFLSPNEVAGTLRLVDRASFELFKETNVVKLCDDAPHEIFATRWSMHNACWDLTRKERNKLTCLIAATGNVKNLAVALKAAGLALDGSEPFAAGEAGALEACQWLCKPGRLPPSINGRRKVLEGAAKGARREVWEWALEGPAGPDLASSTKAVAAAARAGRVELLERLLALLPDESGSELDWCDVLEAAAAGFDLPALQALCERHGGLQDALPNLYNLELVLAAAAKAEWLLALVGEPHPQHWAAASCAAARVSDGTAKQRLRWLAFWGVPVWEHGILRAAAEARNAGLVWGLLCAGLPDYDGEALTAALEVGDWGALHALREGARELGPDLELELTDQWLGKWAEAACRSGRMEVYTWLVTAFGEAAVLKVLEPVHLVLAALSGGCDMMDLVRSGLRAEAGEPERHCGVAWATALWRAAAEGGCEAALERLCDWGYEVPLDEAFWVWSAAAARGDLHTLRALRRLGGIRLRRCSTWWDDTFAAFAWNEGAGEGAPLQVLRWLDATGWPVDWKRAVEAARERVVWMEEETSWERGQAEAAAVLAWVSQRRVETGSGALTLRRLREHGHSFPDVAVEPGAQ